MGTTVSQKKYVRIYKFEHQETEIKMVDEILDILQKFDYEDAINFMGELTGAWILSYPVDAIRRLERDLKPLDWATAEDDFIYILDRRVEAELDEWRK